MAKSKPLPKQVEFVISILYTLDTWCEMNHFCPPFEEWQKHFRGAIALQGKKEGIFPTEDDIQWGCRLYQMMRKDDE